MRPKLVKISELKVIGMKSSIHHSDYGNIVTLWKRFMPNREMIKNVINDQFMAMQNYSNFNDIKEPFDIWACVEVSSLQNIPEGMTSFIIPVGEYAIFLQKGMDASATYQRIMTEWLPNSGYEIDDRPHFQVMGAKYKNGSPDSEEDFYVPIKLKN